MTKTWITALAAVLGLTATLHAQAPQFRNLPSTEIKVAPLPIDTRAPMTAEPLAPPTLSMPGATTSPAYASAPYAYGTYGPCNSCTSCGSSCNSCSLCNTCETHCRPRLSRVMEMAHKDRPCLEKFWDWLTYRPCEQTSFGCCYYMRPVPDGYTWFLYPGCADGHCGGCCNHAASCNSCGGCGK